MRRAGCICPWRRWSCSDRREYALGDAAPLVVLGLVAVGLGVLTVEETMTIVTK